MGNDRDIRRENSDRLRAGEELLRDAKAGKADAKGRYADLVDYIIRNRGLMGATPEFEQLINLADEIAGAGGWPTASKIQEGFGLNSCAC